MLDERAGLRTLEQDLGLAFVNLPASRHLGSAEIVKGCPDMVIAAKCNNITPPPRRCRATPRAGGASRQTERPPAAQARAAPAARSARSIPWQNRAPCGTATPPPAVPRAEPPAERCRR